MVREAVKHWQLEPLEDTAVSLVSELATNALLHAHSGFAIEITRSARTLRISVLDSSAALPSPRNHSATASTGRGLAMVASMSDAWGSDSHTPPWTKSVWCELPIGPS